MGQRGVADSVQMEKHVQSALTMRSKRWTLLMVMELLPGPLLFGTLKQHLEGISGPVLSGRLKEPVQEGIIGRHVCRLASVRVE